MDFDDWKWAAGAVLLLVLAAVDQLQKRNKALESKVEGYNEPFPSDETEEALAVKEAKALCKRKGNVYTFEKALETVKLIRKVRREREAAKGDGAGGSNKRTA